MKKLLEVVESIFVFLAMGIFIVGEVHAYVVLQPFSNIDHALIFSMDSVVPMQFRLMAYRMGGGQFGDPGVLLPLAGFFVVGIFALSRKITNRGK